MNLLQSCPPHLSDVATLSWAIQSFSTLLFIHMYFRIFTLPKKTNIRGTNCYTAALAVYLLLFSASCYLHTPSLVLRLGHATGARVLTQIC